jgi:ABC-2 type transport system ATP-binding protein
VPLDDQVERVDGDLVAVPHREAVDEDGGVVPPDGRGHRDSLGSRRGPLSGWVPALVGKTDRILSVLRRTVFRVNTSPAIEADNLVKHFGETVAVDGVSFAVPEGTVLGLLGPNGAGKTTTVRMMTTLTKPTSGTARVAGHDVLRDPAGVRRSMGLTGQAATVDELLTGRENLRLVGSLYGLSPSYIKQASDDLLERFSLTDAGNRVVKTYSGGMRRRLDLAVSLIATPPVLFLDEPTTGLDPRSRVELWEVLRELVREGTTLLLTTQYLEEADQLADRIVVIDHGTVIAEGTALELKDQSGRAALVVTVSHGDDLPRAEALLRTLVDEVLDDAAARQLTAPANGLKDMTRIASAFDGTDLQLDDLGLKRPSLDDVFLHLTGRKAEADPVDEGADVNIPGQSGPTDDEELVR